MSALVVSYDGWDLGDNADRRFRRIVAWIGIPALVLAIALPFLELAGLERGGGETVEQRFVSLVPEAAPAEQVEEPAPAPEEQPEPEEAKKPEEKPTEKQVETPPQPKPEPTQAQLQQQAREKAQKSGLLAMSDQLAELRDRSLQGLDTARPLTTDTVTAKAGTGASGGAVDFAQAAAATSGGIGQTGTADTRRSQSGAGLGQRRTTMVESPVGFGKDKSKPGQDGDKLIAGRTLEEIQLVFDRNKGAFYAIFNRAMRDNPNIGAGKIVVSITIAPSGAVTDCKLVSSTFNDPDLERKVIQRVMLMNFGAKAVPEFTYPNYPINFLPS
jgi:protein TonB